ARGAVLLAQAFAEGAAAPARDADPTRWSRKIIWGNQLISGGVLKPDSPFWRADVLWGTPPSRGDNLLSGALPARADAVWAGVGADGCEDGIWESPGEPVNVVWGARCGGADCAGVIQAAGCADGDAACGPPWTAALSGSLSGVLSQSCDASAACGDE